MDEVTWFVPFEEDLKHDRIVMRHGDKERVYVPERKTGKWIMHSGGRQITHAECSNCGMKNYDGFVNYCPNCGAKMEVNG